MAAEDGAASHLTFDPKTQAWIQQLYEAWANNAPLSTYAAIRDGLLGQREHLDMRIATLSAVAKIACSRRPSSHQLDAAASSGWDELSALASIAKSRTSSDGSDNKRKRKRAYNEANRLRNLALVAALWSPQVVFHYGWNSASQVQMNMLRACAAAFPSFLHDFRPRLNAVLLERHRQGIRFCRVKTLNEASIQLHRDFDLGTLTATVADEEAETRWVTSQDGRVAVDDATGLLLRDVRPKHFPMYLLRRDRYGLLAARGEGFSPSSPQIMAAQLFTPITDPLCYPSQGSNSRSPISDLDLRLQPSPPSQDEDHGQQVTHSARYEPQHDAESHFTAVNLAFDPSLSSSDSVVAASLSPIPDAEFLALLHETQIPSGLANVHTTESYDTTGLRTAALTEVVDHLAWPAAMGDLPNPDCNTDAFIDPALGFSSTTRTDSHLTCSTGRADPEGLSLSDQTTASVPANPQHYQKPSPVDRLLTSAPLSSSLVHKHPILHTGTVPHPLCVGSYPVVRPDPLTVEEALHSRYSDVVAAYLQQISREASETPIGAVGVPSQPLRQDHHLQRAACLNSSTPWALAWTQPGSRLPVRGGARSLAEADVLYLTGDEVLHAAQEQKLQDGNLDIFLQQKPIIIKEKFLDSGMHTNCNVAKLLQASSASVVLQVEVCSLLGRDNTIKPDDGIVDRFLSRLFQSNDNITPVESSVDFDASTLRLRNITKAHRPRLTMLPRFRLLDGLIERLRRHSQSIISAIGSGSDNDHIVERSSCVQDLIDSTSFNTLSLDGAFSGPRIAPLTSGFWIRNLDGILFCTLMFPADIDTLDVEDNIANDDVQEHLNSKQKFFILEQDDVLLIPQGCRVAYALHSPTRGVTEGGLFWDSLNVLQLLEAACNRQATQRASSTEKQQATKTYLESKHDEGAILRELPCLISELKSLVKRHPTDFSGNMDKDSFLRRFQAAVDKFGPVG